jgi:ABC-type sugar transport system ATPase subunit
MGRGPEQSQLAVATSELAVPTEVLRAANITKRFNQTEVLHDVTVSFHRGRVHSICGENGAGKSTLLKVIAGIHRPTSGTVTVGGRTYHGLTVAEARQCGIIPILQDPTLVPVLSIAENLFLGALPMRYGLLEKGRLHRQAKRLLEKYELDFDTDAPVGSLPLGKQRLLEIVRAAEEHPVLIILDEPTASLSTAEVDLLGAVISRLCQDDTAAVAYVSHRLREVLDFGDEVTVLRDGREVATSTTASLDEGSLASMMIGRSYQRVARSAQSSSREPGENEDRVCLQANGVRIRPGTAAFSFEVRANQITGLYGLVGSGRSSLGRALVGLQRAEAGEFSLFGSDYQPHNPKDAARHGVYYCPEDRKVQGLCLRRPIYENVSLINLRPLVGRLGFVDRKRELETTSAICAEVQLRPLDVRYYPAQLSGGNQQKALLARYFLGKAQLLILDEPTAGVDVGARLDMHSVIRARVNKDLGMIVISSDAEEIVTLCDRAYVFQRGTIVGELSRDKITEDSLSRLAVVVSSDQEGHTKNPTDVPANSGGPV